jgi:hypothetical protein
MKSAFIPLAVLLLAIAAVSATAQTGGPVATAAPASAPASRENIATPKNEFGILLGGSFVSSNVLAFSEGRKLVITQVRYARRLIAREHFSLKMTVDFVPAAILIEPENVELTSRIIPGSPWRSVYGWGLVPGGMQMNFRPRKHVQPFAASTFGFLYFNSRVISPAASRFNFTVDMGPGVQIFTSRRRAVTLGYRYHHLSNADISARNPGADSNIFYVGYSIFR